MKKQESDSGKPAIEITGNLCPETAEFARLLIDEATAAARPPARAHGARERDISFPLRRKNKAGWKREGCVTAAWPIIQREFVRAGLESEVSANECTNEDPCPHVGVEIQMTMTGPWTNHGPTRC
ncbi:hypothetical protein Q8A73_021435 [Channa argus]|nr:hypothetical protein Q8A73_021435 [Channa argus]